MTSLSKLPVDRTLAEVRDELYTQISVIQSDYATKGWLPAQLSLNKGVVRGLLELWAFGLHQLYLALAALLPQAFPITATGIWLDWHAAQVGLTRRTATKARGQVAFRRSSTSANVVIPARTLLRTPPDGTGRVHRFVTLAEAVLPAGSREVLVEVESEDYGATANVVTGQISEFVTPVPGVSSVANSADWLLSEAADDEDDDSLRARYQLRWPAVSGLTYHAYASWALEVAGVVAVKVLDQHPRGQGTVDVVVKSTAGVPTQALLDAVSAAIAPHPPVNDDWLVKGPGPVDVAVAGLLTVTHGSESQILAEATTRLQALFTDPSTVSGVDPVQIGQDVPLDLLTATVMAVGGVKRVAWSSPMSNTVVAEDGLAVLASLALSVTWEDA